MQRCKTAGISIPVELMTKIDQDRGDVTRSRYILRLMQRGMKYRKEEIGTELGQSTQTSAFRPIPDSGGDQIL
jgi:hypothetical protein